MSLTSATLLVLHLLVLFSPGSSVTTKIVSSHEKELGPEPCAIVCSGTTGKDTTYWRTWNRHSIYTNVKMTGCGFTTIPTVTTTVSVAAVSTNVIGAAQVSYVSRENFRLYLHGLVDMEGDLTTKYASDRDYSVNWLAVGYNC